MNITFDITKAHALNLGQQYDHNLTTVTFTGFVPEDTEHTVYLKFAGLGIYPLYDMGFTVSQVFTLKCGKFKGQLLEIAADGTLIKNSKIFDIMVKPSINEDIEIVEQDPNVDLWFAEMGELYQTVEEKLENGEFNGKSAYEIAVENGYVGEESEWIEWVQNKITSEKIIEELGYTPADAASVPVVYDWALQPDKPSYNYTEVGAMPDDTFIPTKVSDLDNDSGFINDVSDKVDVSTFNKYTKDTDSAIKDILLNKLDVADNDGEPGQLLTKTTDRYEWMDLDTEGIEYELLNTIVLDSDTLTITCTKEDSGDDLDLKSILAVLSNQSGLNGGSNAICYLYDSSNTVIGGMPVYFYANASVIQAAVGASIKGDIVVMDSIGWTSAAYSPVNKSLIGEVNGAGNIAKIELTGNGNSFRRGTVINIYGVKSI